jgi:hypothetical protein
MSSPGIDGSGIVVTGDNGRRCGVGPGVPAFRSCVQGTTGSGGPKRRDPVGAAA